MLSRLENEVLSQGAGNGPQLFGPS
jgi:hypothetical protein